MRKFDKALILLIGAGIFFNYLKEQFYKNPNEIVVAGHHVDKQLCMSGMNEFFGRGVDSSKMCDCLIPNFYLLIKDDPEKVRKFAEMGFFKTEGETRAKAMLLFRDCVLESIADTSYKWDIMKFKEPFLQLLKDSIKIMPGWEKINIDRLGNCLLENLDGKITIKEYFSEDYTKVDRLKEIILKCYTPEWENE